MNLAIPLAKVTKVFPDKNGVVRSVMLKTHSGPVKRPISKLCHILSSSTQT